MSNLIGLWSVIALVAAAIAIGYTITIYNSLVRLKNNIERAWANIDVLLKQRFDELPNVVETVKGYAKYEKTVLNNITKLRTQFLTAHNLADKANASQALSTTFATVFAVAENYPKLQASQNFLALQQRISELENSIADRREFYNDSVNTYNTRIEQFPYSIFASIFSYTRKDLFKATDAEKQVPSTAV